MNIQEELEIRDEYFALAKELCLRIIDKSNIKSIKSVISIGGESGCGKSTTAFCLQKEFSQININCAILHMDSYFKLPPMDNHQNRLKSLDNVGPHELSMGLLNKHILSFKNGEKAIEMPIVDYKKNCFSSTTLDIFDVDILIVEGVYSFLLDYIDLRIFLIRNYKETYQNRIKRTREVYDKVIEDILEIEHKIVSPMIKKADFVINKDYKIL